MLKLGSCMFVCAAYFGILIHLTLNLFSVHFLLFVRYPFTDFALIRVSVEILHCLSGS